ncbi:MAG: helix-turn-helix transcriptional regulator [Spirulinaceae cyanobacterium]
MSRPYNSLSFALEILKRLADRPHSRKELGQAMEQYLEAHGKPSDDVLQKLTRTIRKLRDCGFEIESAPHHPYVLKQSSFPLLLSEEQHHALALATQMLEQMGFSAPASQLKQLHLNWESDSPPDFHTDFSPPVDYSEAHLPQIVTALQDRIHKERCFAIRYRSSKGDVQMWDTDRSELRLHHGVLYFFAYVPEWRPWHSKPPSFEQNITFRADRILQVYPASESHWVSSSFHPETITYRMTGPLKTYQPRRHHEQIIEQTEEYVDITTEEDCLFWFRQRILQYGAHVQVLSPPWLVAVIQQEIEQAYLRYQTLCSSQQ